MSWLRNKRACLLCITTFMCKWSFLPGETSLRLILGLCWCVCVCVSEGRRAPGSCRPVARAGLPTALSGRQHNSTVSSYSLILRSGSLHATPPPGPSGLSPLSSSRSSLAAGHVTCGATCVPSSPRLRCYPPGFTSTRLVSQRSGGLKPDRLGGVERGCGRTGLACRWFGISAACRHVWSPM